MFPVFRWPVAATRRFLYTQQGEKHLKYTISLNSHNLPEKVYYAFYVREETEAQGSEGPCPGPHHQTQVWSGPRGACPQL